MDLNLMLSAQTLRLAPELQQSEVANGVLVVKNVLAKTYLRVTPAQWTILQQFREPSTVPAVLDLMIRERLCPPLGEFFELIVKAVGKNILLEPIVTSTSVHACDWHFTIRPEPLLRPLLVLFSLGLIISLKFPPQLPSTAWEVVAGVLVLSAALSLGAAFSACLVRGGGAEVYRPHWKWAALPPHFEIDTADAVMLSPRAQTAAVLGRAAMLAVAVGLTVWHQPSWSCFPILGLILFVRPIFNGRFGDVIQFWREQALSDAEHSHVCPLNRSPKRRWKLLNRVLRDSTTWLRLAHGVLWTLLVIYFGARLTEMPPWTFAFWQSYGSHVGLGIAGSLGALALGYLGWEIFGFLRLKAESQRNAIRQWRTRWLGGRKLVLDESSRRAVLGKSPLLSVLPPQERLQLVRLMEPARVGPWRSLSAQYGAHPTHVAVIVSGKIGLRRELRSGRSVRVQVLSEGDVIGLHDLADPARPNYLLSTLTPVVLLTMSRESAQETIIRKTSPSTLTDRVLKLPFLRHSSLCENWHLQAVLRFAQLSKLSDCLSGQRILWEGQQALDFCVVFEGDAHVSRNSERVGKLRAGEFFGEISLLENSCVGSTVTAGDEMRCLTVPRREFMRFVTHNHMVAVELERVSSERLGRPIFPMSPGQFSPI